MQGLADGYFVAPYTIGNYLAQGGLKKVDTEAREFTGAESEVKAGIDRLLKVGARGKKTVHEFRRELGRILWENVGMARNEQGLQTAIREIADLREDYWRNVKINGGGDYLHKNLEDAGRVADFLELGELLALDALDRRESCGGHFREESQTAEGEAQRDDQNFAYVAAWEYKGAGVKPELNKEPLVFENVKLTQRSYK
jgi:succinate dehydrogenase / fumarate reductase flavoprotein subunit